MEQALTISEIKGSRITDAKPFSPQQIQELEMSIVRNALAAFYVDTAKLQEDEVETHEEQNQDRKQHDKRENPKAHGRLKPTRKGHTEETINEEGE